MYHIHAALLANKEKHLSKAIKLYEAQRSKILGPKSPLLNEL